MQTFKTYKEAQERLEKLGSHTGKRIFNRKKVSWRTPAQKKRITRPYVVATEMEWLNFE